MLISVIRFVGSCCEPERCTARFCHPEVRTQSYIEWSSTPGWMWESWVGLWRAYVLNKPCDYRHVSQLHTHTVTWVSRVGRRFQLLTLPEQARTRGRTHQHTDKQHAHPPSLSSGAQPISVVAYSATGVRSRVPPCLCLSGRKVEHGYLFIY